MKEKAMIISFLILSICINFALAEITGEAVVVAVAAAEVVVLLLLL